MCIVKRPSGLRSGATNTTGDCKRSAKTAGPRGVFARPKEKYIYIDEIVEFTRYWYTHPLQYLDSHPSPRHLILNYEDLIQRPEFVLHAFYEQFGYPDKPGLELIVDQAVKETLSFHSEHVYSYEEMGFTRAQIVELDRTLRELAQSLEPTSVLESPLTDVLRREVDAFQGRTRIRATLELDGDLDSLTASQRIALYRIVQEGLANVREHSGANEVQIRVRGGDCGTEAQIVDDGRGFEVAKTLIRAAKRGRLGLVGMGERVRLLGGSFDVDSRPGGPTSISLVLPRWQPVAAADVTEPALL